MRKSNIVYIIASILIGGIVGATAATSIDATLTERKIINRGTCINNILEHPLISYNDHTYMSVRDIGKVFFRNVEWYESHNEIQLQACKGQGLLKKTETALKIGRAISEDMYHDKITDDTFFSVNFASLDTLQIEDFYIVNVIFEPKRLFDPDNPDDILYISNNCDLRIEISPYDGSFSIGERQQDGTLKYIFEAPSHFSAYMK